MQLAIMPHMKKECPKPWERIALADQGCGKCGSRLSEDESNEIAFEDEGYTEEGANTPSQLWLDARRIEHQATVTR